MEVGQTLELPFFRLETGVEDATAEATNWTDSIDFRSFWLAGLGTYLIIFAGEPGTNFCFFFFFGLSLIKQ